MREESDPKFLEEEERGSFSGARERVHFLLNKLNKLLQLKVDLDQLLTLTREFGDATSTWLRAGGQLAPQEAYFRAAVEKLMRKGKIYEINHDVRAILSHLRQLVQFQSIDAPTPGSLSALMRMHCDAKSTNPLRDRAAFLHFVLGRLDSSSIQFSCKDRNL